MQIFSLEFVAFVALAWLLMNIPAGTRWRSAVLVLTGLYFFNTFHRWLPVKEWLVGAGVPTSLLGEGWANPGQATTWMWLGIFLLSGWLMVCVCRFVKAAGPQRALFICLGAAHVTIYLMLSKKAFFTGQVPDLAPLWTRLAVFTGISYMLLKQFHICFDLRNGQLQRVTPLEYLSFMLAFHTLLMGPIMRLQDFRAQLAGGPPQQSTLLIARSLNRIATGLVKKYVVVSILYEAVRSQTDGHGLMKEPRDIWAAFHIFALYEFLDFSGYCDIMIGVGRLIGVIPPENFRRPYFARNMIDFWTRWHITLANWVRDYFFRPITIRMGRLTDGRYLSAVAFVAYSLSFLLVGLWHEISLSFMLWGLSQGVGMGVVRIYDDLLRRLLSRKAFKAYQENGVIRVIMTLITLEYFVISVGLVVLGLWDVI